VKGITKGKNNKINMETDKTEEEMFFDDIQETRNSQGIQTPEKPQQKWEERAIINNLLIIEVINKRQRELQDKIRENPLDFFSILVWEVEFEKLKYDKEKLLKKNEKLWKSMGKQSPPVQYLTVYIPEYRKPNPNIGYAPIDLSSLAPRYQEDHELKETEKKLEELHERKDKLFIEIQQTATCIADQRMKDELDEITRLEATLMTKSEEIRLSKNANISINKHQNIEHRASMEFNNVGREEDMGAKENVHEWNGHEKVEDTLQGFIRDEQKEPDRDLLDTFEEIQEIRNCLEDEKDDLNLDKSDVERD